MGDQVLRGVVLLIRPFSLLSYFQLVKKYIYLWCSLRENQVSDVFGLLYLNTHIVIFALSSPFYQNFLDVVDRYTFRIHNFR